jgi:hypothetical protein
MKSLSLTAVFVLALDPLARGAEESPAAELDEARSAWKFRCEVSLSGAAQEGKPPFAALGLPVEVLAASRPDLRDLRIVDPSGSEVPFAIDRREGREQGRRWDGRLADTRSSAKESTTWTVDFQEVRSFDVLELRVDAQDFSKRIDVEAADGPHGPWKAIREDAGVFDRLWDFRVHHTAIDLGSSVTARFVRLVADDRVSHPIAVRGVSAVSQRPVPGERWRVSCAAAVLPREGTSSWYRLDLPAGLPFDTFELEADGSAFSRPVILHEERMVNGRTEGASIGSGRVYRLRIPDADLKGESLVVPARASGGGSILLEIVDGDSPPLQNVRGTVSGTVVRLVFPIEANGAGKWTLYHGNPATRPPVYDLEGLESVLGLQRELASVQLGPVTANPCFREAPPLEFVAGVGAPLDTRRWRAMRALSLSSEEDIYTVTLAPMDVGNLQSDLGDLRIVDPAGRQVPYLLVAGAAERDVALEVESVSGSSKDASGRAVSRHRLRVPDAGRGTRVSLPLSAVRLEFADKFFSRPARIHDAGPRQGRILFSGVLERKEGSAVPLTIGLQEARLHELLLEIEEGDNAPLTLTAARAVVPVPRVVFKLKPEPGEYHLLLGNPEAEPPRYDIQSLRREVLAYSAVPAELGELQENVAYRRAFSDFFESAPPALVLWGILIVAVAGLLYLTVRLVRKPDS